jgi:8-oxo-dGTP pyrophosphatase MutT (NUDIX family)
VARRVARSQSQATASVALSEPPHDPLTVRAAGGVVWRPVLPDGWQVALVHRPKYDDWSLPKGKPDSPDEPDETTALREVEEETGLRCALERELESVRYHDRNGRPKVVRFWLMHAVDDNAPLRATADDEIDDVRWCSPVEAAKLLTYERDRELVAGLAGRGKGGA